MKKRLILLALMLFVMLLSSCSSVDSRPTENNVTEYKKITAEEAKARMDSGDEMVILDVRTQAEFDAGHIAGAILKPNETISDQRPHLLSDLDAEILVYCRSGNRSEQAANKLIDIGYTNVYDFGGIINWPYDIVMD